MQFRIGIEDLVSNSFIEIIRRNEKKRFLPYSKIEEYGRKVINILEKKNEKVVLILSRNNTENFLQDYSDFFEEIEMEGEIGILLKTHIKEEDLIRHFRGYWSFCVLQTFIDKEAVKVLIEE